MAQLNLNKFDGEERPHAKVQDSLRRYLKRYRK
jgi:hypothetical protein